MQDETQQPHPFEAEDTVNHNVYLVSRQIDKILHRQPVEDHAAILGMIQVTSQRRMHEHQLRQQREQQARQAEAQRKAQFGVQ